MQRRTGLITMAARDAKLQGLVAPGRVDSRVSTDPAIFALEMERIFGQVWLYAAHESQLREHGDCHGSTVGTAWAPPAGASTLDCGSA